MASKKVILCWLSLLAIFAQSLVLACDVSVINEIKRILIQFSVYKKNLKYLDKLNCSNINKVLLKIDPYSRWIPHPPILKKDKNNVIGIGAILLERSNRFFLMPYKFSPLFKHSNGDLIELFAIDGWIVRGQKYRQVSKRLRGTEGSVVRLTVKLRKRLKSLYVIREKYKPPAVELLSLNRQAFFRIFHFESREVTNFVRDKIENSKYKEVIFDLRACPGGDLFEALDLASLFLFPGNKLAILENSTGKRRLITVPSNLPTFNQSVQIIVGHSTASAAEIFAGIMRYYKRAKIVGKKTAGKCVSQREYHLSDGSILKISNLKIFFPDMSTCQKTGIILDTYSAY